MRRLCVPGQPREVRRGAGTGPRVRLWKRRCGTGFPLPVRSDGDRLEIPPGIDNTLNSDIRMKDEARGNLGFRVSRCEAGVSGGYGIGIRCPERTPGSQKAMGCSILGAVILDLSDGPL